jgi:hypothetical protein
MKEVGIIAEAEWYKYACNETNLMHYLSSVYSVTIPLDVSGLLVAHHQEVTMYVGNSISKLQIQVAT